MTNVAQTLVSAASRFVSTQSRVPTNSGARAGCRGCRVETSDDAFRTRSETLDADRQTRRDEYRRGRHECPRHIGEARP